MPTNTQIMDKIEKKIYKDTGNGCWIWTGSINAAGKPQVFIDERGNGGKMVTVFPHIFLYELEYGEQEARYVDNTCGQKRCVIPAHQLPRTLEVRLQNYKVDENGCWNWLGNKFPKTGYGSITIDGISRSTHRTSYEFHIGKIPDGLMVLHKCNNRTCINPDHFYVGTHANNMQDMANSNAMKGERNPKSILTKDNVVEIKKLIASRQVVYRNIAAQFGVSRQAIKDIACGRTWGWVDQDKDNNK